MPLDPIKFHIVKSSRDSAGTGCLLMRRKTATCRVRPHCTSGVGHVRKEETTIVDSVP